MTIHFTCRQTRLTPALRQFSEEKLARLERYLDKDREVHMVLTVEKHRHQAEMTINSSRRHFASTAITDDLYTAIGLVLDKMGKQLRRDKRRRTASRRHDPRPVRAAGTLDTPSGNGGGSVSQRRILKEDTRTEAMTVDQAADDLVASESPFLVFRNTESGQMNVIYRRPDGDFALIED
jgi:putative sigma-54 modulation protein